MFRHLAKKTLTTEARDALPSSAFVFPRERRYPINDLYHGRLALIYVLSPSNGKDRAAVSKAVLSKYPSLISFWREKSALHPPRSTKSMHYLQNPYGINLPSGARAVTVGMSAERRHLLNASTGYPLCGVGEKKQLAVYPSKAHKVDCYRCIKLHLMNTGEGFATAERYMRPGDRTKRLKHIMIEGGREGEFIGQHLSKPARKPLGPRRTEFGPHEVPEFAWGGLKRQKGQGPTQTRFSDRTDMIQLAPAQGIEFEQFIARVESRPGYAGLRRKNPSPTYRSSKRGTPIVTHVGGERPFAVEFMGNIFTYKTEKKATDAVELLMTSKAGGYEREALRTAAAMQYRYNPAAKKQASRPSGRVGGEHTRSDVDMMIAGLRAGAQVYENEDISVKVPRNMRRSFTDPSATIIPFGEFLRRAKSAAGVSGKSDAFERGAKDAWFEAKAYIEDAVGETAPPRFRNPAAKRQAKKPSARAAGASARSDVDHTILGTRAGAEVYAAGNVSVRVPRSSRASFRDASATIIPYAEFLRRAKSYAGVSGSNAAFERGVKDAWYEAKAYIEDAVGEIAPPRFRNNPRDWAIAYEGRLQNLTAESDGLIHVGRYNPMRSFQTRDGRTVSFNTKKNRRA